MIVSPREKYRIAFIHPKRSGKVDNSGTRHKKKYGNPEILYCMCGGTVKMVNVFRNGKLQPAAKCLKCGKERRKPTQFV